MESIVLASGSLRRQEYFRLLGLPFKIIPPLIDETNSTGACAADFALKMASKKVQNVVESFCGEAPPWIFAADTVVSLEGKIFGKSFSREAAQETLKTLSGNEHEVKTACALFNGRSGACDHRLATTKVTFAALSREDIEWYLDSGEWQGAAGSYRIQGLGSCLVLKIDGSYSNVVGLPLREFYEMLKTNGYAYP
ncbi:MAG: Maf family protein [Spirochaetaceae bacterium]|jgi:septum formation protein|nr:Maf family protein [Spirochaetaceae bacterium]